jgi:hypothetical protein
MNSFNEPALVLWGDYRKNFLNIVVYYFLDDLVACVAERDWLESSKS